MKGFSGVLLATAVACWIPQPEMNAGIVSTAPLAAAPPRNSLRFILDNPLHSKTFG
jgi:hypothetical protein